MKDPLDNKDPSFLFLIIINLTQRNLMINPYCKTGLIFTLRNLFLPCIFFLGTSISQAQALFNVTDDTICIDDSLVIENQSGDADSYYWNFCSGNLEYIPQGENIPYPTTLNGPAFIDFAEENDAMFAFITNHTDGTITRNYYGTSFLNDPTSQNLGNFGGVIPAHVQGVQIINDAGNWYVFIVGGQREDSKIVRLDFGNSLSNSPTVHDFGNIGNLDYPEDLYITNESGNWIGFTVNYNTNSITRFEFGSSVGTNSVTATNLGNIGNFNKPCGIFPIYENGNWYLFISNYGGNNISRLNFGTSLIASPSGTSIGDDTYLDYPFDLTILRDCEKVFGFVLNRFNDIVRMEFSDGIDNEPVFTSLGEIGNLFNPQGISDVFRVGDTLYSFVANIDNSSITRLFFPGCTNATPSSSTDKNPGSVRYNAAGNYNITLVLNEGQPNQQNYCRNIVVLDSADVWLGNDTLITAGTTITLQSRGDSTYASYQWSTGSTTPTIEVNQAGVYTLRVTNKEGCVATDNIEVIVDIGIPNFFTPNADGYNDTWHIPFLETEPEAEISIFDRFGNLLAKYKASETDWDGKSNNANLPMGTYWYVIEVPGLKKPYKGPVTIKR